PSLSKFIFYDDSVEPQPPKLPTSRIFQNKGNAVFRTGWDKDAIIFLYRAGPNFNHHHADQGSFLLNAFGENLVTEAGWSDYYKDPFYATFFTQAIGHSTVLVDGNPESQSIADTPQFTALNSYPRITDAVTSEFYDSVSSELASVYQDRLERFTRRIVFIKPHYLVIFDDLVAKGEPARFDWLLHLPDRSRIEIQDKLAIYQGKQAALAAHVFAPGKLHMKVREGRVPYHDFATRTPPATPAQPAFLDLATRPMRATRFLVALVPARTIAAAQALSGNMSEVKSEQWFGIDTRRGSERDLVMFRVAGPSHPLAYDKWLTDAASWSVTEAGEQLVMLSAHNARTVSRSGRQLFRSDKPASFAAHFDVEKVQANVSATGATQIRLFTGVPPAKVQIDGRDLAQASTNYISSEGMISLLVPAGQHELVFALR
ncbi:MAG: heparinase II/III-family protein, partial [Acidobacteriota bacterium]|nr:heparinase II/III-family protein [Acidobacteriota bacterium]